MSTERAPNQAALRRCNVATKTVPQAVPFRKPTDTITQEKLAYILTLKGEIQERKKELEQVETEVQAALEVRVPVE